MFAVPCARNGGKIEAGFQSRRLLSTPAYPSNGFHFVEPDELVQTYKEITLVAYVPVFLFFSTPGRHSEDASPWTSALR
jgi:hypothetical protein